MNEEHEIWDFKIEGENDEGGKATLDVHHYSDTGRLSLVLDKDGRKSVYLDSNEWLRLINCLLTQRQLRDWLDRKQEEKESAEIVARLALFERMGLQDKELLRAAMLPKLGEENEQRTL